MKNTFVDFIKTNRLHERIVQYEVANEANLIQNIRTPCEVQYERTGDGGYLLTTFTYSKCCFRKLKVEGHECFPVKNYVYMDCADKEKFSFDEDDDGGNVSSKKDS